METWYYIGSILILLALAWWVMDGFRIPCRKGERRKTDFYRIYNEQEDRTETMFDARNEDRRKQ